jgi:hypothetical protein
MIVFVKLTKGIGHKFYQLMKSSPINTINSHSIMIILSIHIIHIEIYWLLIIALVSSNFCCHGDKKCNLQHSSPWRSMTPECSLPHQAPLKPGWTHVLRKGKQFLLHMWHPSFYLCYKPGDKLWMRNYKWCCLYQYCLCM